MSFAYRFGWGKNWLILASEGVSKRPLDPTHPKDLIKLEPYLIWSSGSCS